MKPLPASILLDAWERAAAVSPAERPLVLLALTDPDTPMAELEQFSIAQRDGRLLALRQELFGAQVRSLVPCPRCNESVELVFSTSDVQPARNETPPATSLTFRTDGFMGTFRLPVSSDWIALTQNAHGAPACASDLRQALARRCLLTLAAESRGPTGGCATVAPRDQPPAEVLAAVADAIARCDADAHTELNVTCLSCGYEWPALFDIASFLWRELDLHCRRLLQQVHRLAQAYGWTEAEILRLTPARREHYLTLIDHG